MLAAERKHTVADDRWGWTLLNGRTNSSHGYTAVARGGGWLWVSQSQVEPDLPNSARAC